MKKLFLVLMIVSLAALFAIPAMAHEQRGPDCNVDVSVDVYKAALYLESTYISKCLDLKVDAHIRANQWAEATIQDCQVNAGNEFSAKGDPGRPASTVTTTGSGTYSGDITGTVKGVVFDDPEKDHKDERYSRSRDRDCDPKGKDDHKVDKDPFFGKIKATESGTFNFTAETKISAIAPKPVIFSDTISDSFEGFVGIAQVNQAAGSGNNQGNALAAAVTDPSFNDKNKKDDDPKYTFNSNSRDDRRDRDNNNDPKAVSHTEVAIGQLNTYNYVCAEAAEFSDTISDSFDNFKGVAQVNQAAGFANNQKNAAAIAANVNTAGAVAISDTFMSQTNACNSAEYGCGYKSTASIDGSFQNGAGLVQVNQSPGSMNNQANTVAVSYSGANFR
jgi:hypothetical protein